MEALVGVRLGGGRVCVMVGALAVGWWIVAVVVRGGLGCGG